MNQLNFKKKSEKDVLRIAGYPVKSGNLPLLHFPLLEETDMVIHGFTTRLGGVSSGI